MEREKTWKNGQKNVDTFEHMNYNKLRKDVTKQNDKIKEEQNVEKQILMAMIACSWTDWK